MRSEGDGHKPSIDATFCRGAQVRCLTTAKLPDLPYDYGALHPAISGGFHRGLPCTQHMRSNTLFSDPRWTA